MKKMRYKAIFFLLKFLCIKNKSRYFALRLKYVIE